ncbi:protein STRUBBELIG-RECEPTOR FAMILY 2-like [Trifolium medium]|uniref:Protein STRUBBELIG-RECEPTOR FAMILY 2-like n=1 Tax=Trifolium medium TaxID=97028 RepID=A0A392PF59_9FABA|nr:protein STRUBBELIG-RECEPTOR FAMILY 2-like [Trifolium medium]
MGETSRRSFSERDKFTGRTKVYTVAEVQLVTNNFSEDNLLGVFAVKNIQMARVIFQ